jgi:hypothetical protein
MRNPTKADRREAESCSESVGEVRGAVAVRSLISKAIVFSAVDEMTFSL